LAVSIAVCQLIVLGCSGHTISGVDWNIAASELEAVHGSIIVEKNHACLTEHSENQAGNEGEEDFHVDRVSRWLRLDVMVDED
jgi:hypothetical protein